MVYLHSNDIGSSMQTEVKTKIRKLCVTYRFFFILIFINEY